MTVKRLERQRFDDVVHVLRAAFRDYPVMRYVVGDAPDYELGLTRLVSHFTELRFSRDYPVLGVESSDGSLVAAANLNPPRTLPAPPSVERSYAALREAVGDGGIARYEAFAAACCPLEPDEPHWYVGMIGVLPERQGTGLARLLLDAVHARSARDEGSFGVCLTTETEENLGLYEHFGYMVVGRATTADGDLTTWTLFRPDP